VRARYGAVSPRGVRGARRALCGASRRSHKSLARFGRDPFEHTYGGTAGLRAEHWGNGCDVRGPPSRRDRWLCYASLPFRLTTGAGKPAKRQGRHRESAARSDRCLRRARLECPCRIAVGRETRTPWALCLGRRSRKCAGRIGSPQSRLRQEPKRFGRRVRLGLAVDRHAATRTSETSQPSARSFSRWPSASSRDP
jgi:hypothetical protein